MPELLIIRHAKAEVHGESDSARHLSPRGMAQCAELRGHHQHRLNRLDRALVSPAVRTQETWALISKGLAVPDAELEPLIYESTPGTLLAIVNALDGERVVLVGHNPGVGRLAALLADSTELPTELAAGFGTAASAVLRCDLPFSQWAPGCAEVVDSFRPAAAED